jgi:hypothetical protein
MPVHIAEYLGQRTDTDGENILVAQKGDRCPFMDHPCTKLLRDNKPVCTVRQNNGVPWIVCADRLCSTKSNIRLNEYQRNVLLEVAKAVFGQNINSDDVLIRREVAIPVVENSTYHADYIMIYNGNSRDSNGPIQVVLEMQGGGETSNTGHITRLISDWENEPIQRNELLRKPVNAAPIVTNAWRRQQEQFLIKGNVAEQTGGGIVFCVGEPLFDYLWSRVSERRLSDLRSDYWTLALLAFRENTDVTAVSLKYEIHPEKQLFTNYRNFVNALITQGAPNRQMFTGQFESLNGSIVII